MYLEHLLRVASCDKAGPVLSEENTCTSTRISCSTHRPYTSSCTVKQVNKNVLSSVYFSLTNARHCSRYLQILSKMFMKSAELNASSVGNVP